MYTQMQTTKLGGELISFKINGEEKIHQGEAVIDENGKTYWGAGMDTDIITASIKALISAVNRMD